MLGHLFRAPGGEDHSFQPSLGEKEAQLVVDSCGRRLISDYWGTYVAFLYDEHRNRHFVVRDPGAALPCFTLSHDGVDIFFSWMPDLADFGDLSLTVNWKYIAAWLLHDQLRICDTGLNEVRELLAGQCLELGEAGRESCFYWNPKAFAQSDGYENVAEAVRALGSTTRSCVLAWASRYSRIILELSGGLDSAIVLGCLSTPSVNAEVFCLNVHTDHPDGDERHFARLAAGRAGRKLFEMVQSLSDQEITRALDTPRFPNPTLYVLATGFDDIYSRMALELGADACFTGQGGDHLFHENKVSLIAADHLMRHGFGRAFLKAAYATAFFTQLSFWSVLRQAISVGMFRRQWPLYPDLQNRRTFLSPDALALLPDDYILHPWLRTADCLAPAKFRQVSALVDFQSYYWPSARAQYADVVYPLFSQPLIELCLRIPTYVLTAGGRDRGLARRSFASDVPPEIIGRRTKGAIGSYFTSMLSRNAEVIREMLLDGKLASSGIINRQRLEADLRLRQLERGEHFVHLMTYISMEVWLRSWSSRRMLAGD